MGRRGGLKNKVNKRIAHIKWLLYTKTPPPAWITAQKLQSELDYLKTSLEVKNPIHATHSANIQVINNVKLTKPPSPKQLPKRPKLCPKDCEGPLNSPHCEYTCAAGTGPPSKKK